ncbi:glycoside hydrolase family 13 protein [Isoptericola variabilis]|uniref:Alpha amylase catalytic region n=1 Tax=Isoptericola variabilis (strain 225) TaxID=743718 RepID=F6FXF2_ISOV2|nr:glycoside hydrolase family 13 protein [Isoptericola variabilis]AEG44680.1 alpha amylase catalytic region [Isoptericola variabilis 225]
MHLLDAPHHDGSASYVPEGTPALGDVVPVRVRVPRTAGVRDVWLRTVRDGEPRLTPARRDGGDEREDWYVADVVVHNPVTPYRFFLDVPGGYRWLDGRGVHDREVPDAGSFRLTTHAPAPSWLGEGLVYQVFPDRFARSAAADARPLPDWAVPAAWDDEPLGAGPHVGTQLFGGDLPGIVEHLDHLETLGVRTLYLTPVFPGRSNHRYDASTFDHVDPLLGGDEAYAELARAVHARGMRLMGDITTNHTGDGHEWFARALADPSSPEHGMYLWADAPPGTAGTDVALQDDGLAYASWLGHGSLPKLDWGSDETWRRMVTGDDAVVARWLREPFGIDGWRVDVANMTGRWGSEDRTHAVARALRERITRERPDGALVAEHFHDASGDLLGDGWHANMNYTGFTRPAWSWLAAEDSGVPFLGLPTAVPRRPAARMVETMREFASTVPWQVTVRQWSMLGSHDTARLRSIVGSREMVEVAAALLFTYPGTPVVFAGDEVGATGLNGEHARTTMAWDQGARGGGPRWDAATLEVYRSLSRLRAASRALRDGGLRWAVVEDDAVAYLRETPDERLLVVLARAPWSGARLPRHLLAPGARPELLYGDLELTVTDGGLDVAGDGPAVGIHRLA